MKILFFAQTRDVAGTSELEMTIPDNTGVDDLWKLLIAAHPKLAAFRKTTRLARNGEYGDASTRFSDTDEVALIPPVSGG